MIETLRTAPATLALLAGVVGATGLAGQTSLDAPPAGLAQVERERSRACVTTLEDVEALDRVLAPLAARSRRLLAISEAIALEERAVVAELDPSDPVESDVQAWFATDSLLAVRFVQSGNEALQEQRRVGRDAIKEQVSGALETIQQQADSIVAETGDLGARAGPCDGAIFVRPAVVEACGERSTALCTAAAAPPDPAGPFRFVDAPEAVWDVQELRPWTNAGPLRVGATGLEGARTIGYARIGNVVVTAAFTALLKEREQATPAELVTFDQTNQALAITFGHPDVAFAPALALRAALPRPLGGENRYLVHFGPAGDPDVLWTGQAGTGRTLQASVPISPAHVLKLRNGQQLSLTAVRGDDPVFTVSLSQANQAPAVTALLRYMSAQLDADLRRIAPPRGG